MNDRYTAKEIEKQLCEAVGVLLDIEKTCLMNRTRYLLLAPEETIRIHWIMNGLEELRRQSIDNPQLVHDDKFMSRFHSYVNDTVDLYGAVEPRIKNLSEILDATYSVLETVYEIVKK